MNQFARECRNAVAMRTARECRKCKYSPHLGSQWDPPFGTKVPVRTINFNFFDLPIPNGLRPCGVASSFLPRVRGSVRASFCYCDMLPPVETCTTSASTLYRMYDLMLRCMPGTQLPAPRITPCGLPMRCALREQAPSRLLRHVSSRDCASL